MVRFRWYDVIKYHDLIDNTQSIRQTIETYGVDTMDDNGYMIFDYMDECRFNQEMIDIIFEFRPTFPSFFRYYGRGDDVISNYSCLYLYKCYILSKFLEHDDDYHYIRCRFVYYGREYPDFVRFYYRKNHDNDTRYVMLFTNHFLKGISMFELMKYKLQIKGFY